jgi:hypothetical protein
MQIDNHEGSIEYDKLRFVNNILKLLTIKLLTVPQPLHGFDYQYNLFLLD